MIDFNTFEPFTIMPDGTMRDNSITVEDKVPGRSISVKYNVFKETNKILVGIKSIRNPTARTGKHFDIVHDLDKLEENIQYYIDKWYETEPESIE